MRFAFMPWTSIFVPFKSSFFALNSKNVEETSKLPSYSDTQWDIKRVSEKILFISLPSNTLIVMAIPRKSYHFIIWILEMHWPLLTNVRVRYVIKQTKLFRYLIFVFKLSIEFISLRSFAYPYSSDKISNLQILMKKS